MVVQSLVVLLFVLLRSPITVLCRTAANFSNVTPSSSIDNSPALHHENIILWEQQGNFGGLQAKKKRRCKRNPNSCKRISGHHACCFLHVCVNLLKSRFHCGSCGRVCKHGKRCCGGDCVDISRSRNHCGKCRNACSPDESCVYGICGYA